MLDKLTGNTKLLEKALDASWMRNEVISNNIANANTPGYKKGYVRFEDALNAATNDFQISSIAKEEGFLPIGNDVNNVSDPVVQTENNTAMRNDGNNIDVDVEMAELAKNTIKYNTLVSLISKKFSGIKSAINEGRK